MKALKAYIIYGGSPGWWNATLIFENGYAAFGHLCSSPGFMRGDLWENRPERKAVLAEMGYEVEIIGDPIAGSDDPSIQWLVKKHEDKESYRAFGEAYSAIEARLFPKEPA